MRYYLPKFKVFIFKKPKCEELIGVISQKLAANKKDNVDD
jgi:hypothetical protein